MAGASTDRIPPPVLGVAARAVVGATVAAILLMPGSGAATTRNRPWPSINHAPGSAVARIGQAVPAVSFWIGQPRALGIPAGQTTLPAPVARGPGRTNLACGIVHLVLAATCRLRRVRTLVSFVPGRVPRPPSKPGCGAGFC